MGQLNLDCFITPSELLTTLTEYTREGQIFGYATANDNSSVLAEINLSRPESLEFRSIFVSRILIEPENFSNAIRYPAKWSLANIQTATIWENHLSPTFIGARTDWYEGGSVRTNPRALDLAKELTKRLSRLLIATTVQYESDGKTRVRNSFKCSKGAIEWLGNGGKLSLYSGPGGTYKRTEYQIIVETQSIHA